MFGREPRIPLDFLLGHVQEMEHSNVNDWVLEHQTKLQVAFEGPREHLRVMADCCKKQHYSHVRDAPLGKDQLIYLCNYGLRDGHKIQDIWSLVVYQMKKARGLCLYNIMAAMSDSLSAFVP